MKFLNLITISLVSIIPLQSFAAEHCTSVYEDPTEKQLDLIALMYKSMNRAIKTTVTFNEKVGADQKRVILTKSKSGLIDAYIVIGGKKLGPFKSEICSGAKGTITAQLEGTLTVEYYGTRTFQNPSITVVQNGGDLQGTFSAGGQTIGTYTFCEAGTNGCPNAAR